MSDNILADAAALKQDPVHSNQLIDATFLQPIAEALYRFDRRDATADLKRLDPESQVKYRNDAAVVAYMRVETKATPALYFAANYMTNGQIGSMPRAIRMSVVQMVDRTFAMCRKALAGLVEADLQKFIKLAEADVTASRAETEVHKAAEAVTPPAIAIDLAALKPEGGVQ